MTARAVELCEAVAAHIRATPYPYQFDVQRINWTQQRLEQTNYTTLWVYAGGSPTQTAVETRKEWRHHISVALHLTNYLDTNSQAEFDNAIELMELIEDSLKDVDLAGWQMEQFGSDGSGRPMFEIDQVATQNYFHSITYCEYFKLI